MILIGKQAQAHVACYILQTHFTKLIKKCLIHLLKSYSLKAFVDLNIKLRLVCIVFHKFIVLCSFLMQLF